MADAIVLTGFVAKKNRGKDLRISHPTQPEAWIEFPNNAKYVVSSDPVNPADPKGLYRVVVTDVFREEALFKDTANDELDKQQIDGGIKVSVWPLIPDNGYVAAGILELTPWPSA
jgi:hypothetical protein